jgi:fibronectin-binding autotransporter adhesin
MFPTSKLVGAFAPLKNFASWKAASLAGALLVVWSATGVAHAQYSFTSSGQTITENFADWAGTAAPSAAWLLQGFNNGSNSTINTNSANGAQTVFFKGAIAVGVANSGGGFESRGAVNAPGNGRSLSFLANGTFQNAQMRATLQNNTGVTISSLDVAWTSHQWYNGSSRPTSLQLQYSADGTSWTNVANSTFAAPVLTVNANAGVNGLESPNFQAFNLTIAGLSVAAGDSFYVRWLYLGGLTGAGSRQTLGISDLSLTAMTGGYTPQALVWDAAGSGVWSTSATNWVPAGGGAASPFTNTDSATFSNTSGGTITVDAGGVEPSSTVVNAASGTYTFTGGSIGGTSFTKSGGSSVVLESANTFGSVVLEGGTLQADGNAALGSASGGISIANGATLVAGDAIASTRTITMGTGGGTIDTNGNAVAVTSIAGTGAFTKDGAGTLTTLGYTAGQLDVAAGTLEINAGGTTLIGSGGSVDGTLVLGNARRFNFSDGTVSGTGTIEVTSPGAQLATTGAATPAINVVIEPDIVLNTSATTGDPISIGAVGGHSITVNGIISGDSDVRFSAGTSGGAGITTLNAANTYTGNSEFNNAQSAVVRLGVENALPTTTGITWGITQPSGSLDLNGFDQALTFIATGNGGTTGGIANTGSSAVVTLSQAIDSTFAGRIGQTFDIMPTNLTGWNNDISLVKSGTGTLTLTGSNTYTGPTSVLEGGLIIDGVIAGLVNVASDGTIGGNGTIGGSLALAGNGSKFVFDPLQTLTVNGASVSFLGPFGIGDLIGLDADTPLGIYTLIDGESTVLTENLLNLGSGNPFDLGGGKSAFFQTGSLQVAVVPEPSTLALAAAGLGIAAIAARRRLRQA